MKGCKGGEASGSPNRMEQGQPQQNAPIPPSTPSSSSRHQAQGNANVGSPGVCGGVGPQVCGGVGGKGGFMSQWQYPQNVPGVQTQNVPGMQAFPVMSPMMQNQSYPPGFPSGDLRGNGPSASSAPNSRLQQIAELVAGLDASQAMTLQQILGERFQQQQRMMPEFFGEAPRSYGEPFLPDANRDFLGSTNGEGFGGRHMSLDAFSKSEKWLTPAPVPSVETWKSRDLEILGWSEYSNQLVAWAAQGSEEFANEISHASRWHSQIVWDSLSRPQKNRSTRLFSILKAAFSSHPRTNMIIAAFSEGLNVQGSVPGMTLMTEGELKSNGYELLRQLTREFSLRSRAEALSLRTSLAAKSFSLSSSETTVSTVVSDTIRKLDFECNRYMRLISTLPGHVDATGLSLPESDMLMILLRSLPPTVRDFCLHHSIGETFQDYKRSARRWEEQQRLFQELHGTAGQSRKVSQVAAESKQTTEWYTFEDGPEESFDVSAVVGDKCAKCGSKKHSTESCSVDLTKVKCFSCGVAGHIGANCPKKTQHDGKGYGKPKGDKGKGKYGGGKGVVKGHFDKGKNKGKGKKGKPGKGFGKKGKLNELSMSDEDWWWYQDDWSWNRMAVGLWTMLVGMVPIGMVHGVGPEMRVPA